jgi:hypothetical protein
MAKPKIFISSTFFDLRQVRADLDFFIEQLGYEPVRNEEGDIPYGKDEALEEYCYKEVKNIDIIVCIIGGRFGSESKRTKNSITQMEVRQAIKEGKQAYFFIEKNVLAEYETYLLNKELPAIKYRFVDDKRIYEFVEEIKGYSSNNIIKGFETALEITKFLKEQFAGLFQRLLENQSRIKESTLIRGLENTADTLNKLVNYLSLENKENSEEVNRILMINHPLVDVLKNKLRVQYSFYIEGFDDLDGLLSARGYSFNEDYPPWETPHYYTWFRKENKKEFTLKVSSSIFDSEKKLKYIKRSDWNESLLIFSMEEEPLTDDLPF